MWTAEGGPVETVTIRDGRVLATGPEPLSANDSVIWERLPAHERKHGLASADAQFRSGPNLMLTVHGPLTVEAPIVDAQTTRSRTMNEAWLARLGHREIVAITARRGSGFALADRDGFVTVWETIDHCLHDPLPPDPDHAEVTGIAHCGNWIATVAGRGQTLRLWDPASKTVTLRHLDIQPRCVCAAHVGMLYIGHDNGVSAFSMT